MPGWGRTNYEAYAEDADNKSVHDETLPTWESADPKVRKHWDRAADAVIAAYLGAGAEHAVPPGPHA